MLHGEWDGVWGGVELRDYEEGRREEEIQDRSVPEGIRLPGLPLDPLPDDPLPSLLPILPPILPGPLPLRRRLQLLRSLRLPIPRLVNFPRPLTRHRHSLLHGDGHVHPMHKRRDGSIGLSRLRGIGVGAVPADGVYGGVL